MVVEYASRAVVTVDGTAMAPDVDPDVEQVVVDHHLHLPDMFSITFLDPTRNVLTRARLRIGAKVEISGIPLGGQEQRPLLTAEVTAIDGDYDMGGARIQVRGYDPSHRLHRGRQTRTFLNVTDSDIARRIANEAQLEMARSSKPIGPTTTSRRPISPTGISSRHAAMPSVTSSLSWAADFNFRRPAEFRRPLPARGP